MGPKIHTIVYENFVSYLYPLCDINTHPGKLMSSDRAGVGGVAHSEPSVDFVFRISRVVDEPTFEVDRVRGV